MEVEKEKEDTRRGHIEKREKTSAGQQAPSPQSLPLISSLRGGAIGDRDPLRYLFLSNIHKGGRKTSGLPREHRIGASPSSSGVVLFFESTRLAAHTRCLSTTHANSWGLIVFHAAPGPSKKSGMKIRQRVVEKKEESASASRGELPGEAWRRLAARN